jgi:hypothetical protein
MKSILLLLLLGACTHLKQSDKITIDSQDPEWLYSPYEFCVEDQELCAVGEGKSFSDAEASARTNLASIFEVKVQSELTINNFSSQNFPWQGQVKEDVQKSLTESVDQILQGVGIKQRFKSKGISFALASLNRSQATNLIGEKIKLLDQELQVLWNKRQRTNLRRIIRIFLERDKLNEKLSIVSGVGRLSPVSWEEIINWKKSKPENEPLLLKLGQAPDWMKEKLAEILTESGFYLVKADVPKVVSLQVDSIKEFLNVDGFEKYTFTMSLMSIENGQNKKNISTAKTVTGRNQADALLKVRTFFNDYLENHISDLDLD